MKASLEEALVDLLCMLGTLAMEYLEVVEHSSLEPMVWNLEHILDGFFFGLLPLVPLVVAWVVFLLVVVEYPTLLEGYSALVPEDP